jgi:hypothetical protein
MKNFMSLKPDSNGLNLVHSSFHHALSLKTYLALFICPFIDWLNIFKSSCPLKLTIERLQEIKGFIWGILNVSRKPFLFPHGFVYFFFLLL